MDLFDLHRRQLVLLELLLELELELELDLLDLHLLRPLQDLDLD